MMFYVRKKLKQKKLKNAIQFFVIHVRFLSFFFGEEIKKIILEHQKIFQKSLIEHIIDFSLVKVR